MENYYYQPYRFPPFYRYNRNYYRQYSQNKRVQRENINIKKEPPKEEENVQGLRSIGSPSGPIFELFGIQLYFDDILLISLIFFLYNEGVHDQFLFIALILLLLS